jgi:hypothetical protein
MFPRTSRYFSIEIAKYTTADQREIAYLRRRFLPSSEGAIIFAEHKVEQGDRLDNVTAKYLGDPEQFWRLCDVNEAMVPDELTEEIGRWVKIPMPMGG